LILIFCAKKDAGNRFLLTHGVGTLP